MPPKSWQCLEEVNQKDLSLGEFLEIGPLAACRALAKPEGRPHLSTEAFVYSYTRPLQKLLLPFSILDLTRAGRECHLATLLGADCAVSPECLPDFCCTNHRAARGVDLVRLTAQVSRFCHEQETTPAGGLRISGEWRGIRSLNSACLTTIKIEPYLQLPKPSIV